MNNPLTDEAKIIRIKTIKWKRTLKTHPLLAELMALAFEDTERAISVAFDVGPLVPVAKGKSPYPDP